MRPDALLRFAPFRHTTHVYGVGELAQRIGAVLENDDVLHDVWLRGEIVTVSRSPAGHTYFTLKDGTSQMRCVLFRGSAFNSPVTPTNGLAVVAHGSVQYYQRQGSCELVADLVFPEGVGLAQMKAEQRYRELDAQGFFAPGRKRALPRMPARVGVVSSERGAVIHDLLSVLSRRYPLAEVVFVPSPVQGRGAGAALARAVTRLAAWRRNGQGADVIVVARGGGSDDDLAAFNEETLVRAIFAAPVPVISAVGHETNLTLADLVADVRAATPSAAAELLAPDVRTLRNDLRTLESHTHGALVQRVGLERRRTREARERLGRQAAHSVSFARQRLAEQSARLRALSPLGTLNRGYAIVFAHDQVLSDASTVSLGDPLRIRLRHGSLISTVDGVEPQI
ncbi:MAG: exodeoxyribonuclease VII large subunit [Chloroflexota bacterium]